MNMLGKYQRCISCMKEIGNNNVCPYCGYIEGSPSLSAYLQPKTVLDQRYIVGKLLSYNGEGATYIAFDTVIEAAVEIREYMPDTLCDRTSGGNGIVVKQGCEAQYKALMSDFADLMRQLSKMRTLTTVVQVYEIFEQNNTVYAVFEHIDGVTLRQYLNENAGEIDWEEASKLFYPIFNTLAAVHSSNLIHRGISPENIIINHKGEIKLTGFSISPLRAYNTELSPQLFGGYAAPEQYVEGAMLGRYTDVYGVAAVIYRAITGTMPPESCTRVQADNLVSMSQLNQMVPQSASRAIAKAMSMDIATRTRTVSDLLDEIKDIRGTADMERVTQETLNQNAATQQGGKDKTPVQPVKKTANTLSAKRVLEVKKKNDNKGPKYGIIAFGITFVVLGIIALWVFFSLYGDKIGDGKETTSNVESTVSAVTSVAFDEKKLPSFVGQQADSIVNDDQYTPYINFETKSDYNSEYPEGVIYAQSPEEDTVLSEDEKITVTLYVSKGEETVRMPRVASLSLESARSALDKLNIGYNEVMVYDESVPVGNVVRADYQVDDEINPKTDTVTLFVSAEIPEE